MIIEDEDILHEDMRPDKRRRDEISRGQRKRRKEDDIRAEKQEHSPTVSPRIQNPEGFYSEDWDKDKQEEDEWQTQVSEDLKDLTDGVSQQSPKDSSKRRQSSLKSPCSTPRGQM